ncbi:MAG: hypothetical protein U5R14_06655 [Gemmatimonadota bacterium]|nr:hypothetical protein [Gemmatimonadota bacterium]
MSLILAFVLVNGILLAPQWAAPGMVPFHWVAGEAVVLTLVFAALPRRPWSVALALLAALIVVAMGLVGLGDASARMSLSRPLNIYLDIRLLSAVSDLLTGTMGPAMATVVRTAAILLPLAVVALLGHLLAPPRRVRPVLRSYRSMGLTVLVASGILVGMRADEGWSRALGFPGARLAAEQARFAAGLLEERDAFAAELAARPADLSGTPGLLGRLGGRDVLLAFVESYGMTALEDPRYAPTIRPRLKEMGSRLEAAGLHLATGRLVAPSQGGQSWLGHGSMLSGLWLHNQMRYDLLLASTRPTLIDDFEAAGYRTAAVMPAITLAWPEGFQFGYDAIYTFEDMGYRGPPLNWVTMPDQYTWSFVERSVRRATPEERPLFAEIGLISSHAPWTPILPVLEAWNEIGDGSVFEEWREAGERPEELWRDTERVREHYALSIDYAVHTAASYAERFIGSDALLILLGDHQPAPLITGEDAPRTVPVHVITGARELLDPFLQWGFETGPFPDVDGEPKGMDRFRTWFIRAFSEERSSRAAGTGG